MASASAQGDPILNLLLGIGKFTSRRQSCSGQVPRPARSPPTAHGLLQYFICHLKPEPAAEEREAWKGYFHNERHHDSRNPKVKKAKLRGQHMAGGTPISTEDLEDVELDLELGNFTLKECKCNDALGRCLGGPT